MRLSIGALVHNDATQEQGRIVRFFNSCQSAGYIVSTTNKTTGQEIEALWFPPDIRELKEQPPTDRKGTTDQGQQRTGPDPDSVGGV